MAGCGAITAHRIGSRDGHARLLPQNQLPLTWEALYATKKTAGSRRVDIDVTGAAITQSTIEQPLHIGAVANVT